MDVKKFEARKYWDTEKCAVFFSTTDTYGFLHNFAPAKCLVDLGIRVPGWSKSEPTIKLTIANTEALYQALKHPTNVDIQRQLILSSVAKDAAQIGRNPKYEIRADWDEVKLSAMKYTLLVKFHNHRDRILDLFDRSEGRVFVEKSSRDKFWGAVDVSKNGILEGNNGLGKMWTLLRHAYELDPEKFDAPPVPKISGFYLYHFDLRRKTLHPNEARRIVPVLPY